MPVVRRRVMLAVIISKVLLSSEPVYTKISLRNLITCTEVAQLEHTRTLSLHSAIHDAHHCHVINIYWGGGLWVAEFLQGESKNVPSVHLHK